MTSFLNTLSAVGALAMAATPLVAIGGVARAQDVAPQHIRIADLDFSRPADRARFESRVDLAARRMCASDIDLTLNATCRQAVHEEAVQKLAGELLAAVPPQTVAVANR